MPARLESSRADRDLRWLFGQRLSVRAYDEKAPAPDWRFCVSTRSSELLFVLDGAIEVSLGSRVVAAGPGEALLSLRGTPHRFRCTPGTRTVIVDLPDVPCPTLGVLPLPADQLPLALERLVPSLWAQRAAPNPAALDRATQPLVAPRAFERLVPLEPTPASARMGQVREWLDAHFREPVRIGELAERFRVSSFYLARAFQRAFGTSPLGYLNHLRLEHFVWSLLEVAAAEPLLALSSGAGFGDYATFCRRVHDYFGRPPSQLVTPA